MKAILLDRQARCGKAVGNVQGFPSLDINNGKESICNIPKAPLLIWVSVITKLLNYNSVIVIAARYIQSEVAELTCMISENIINPILGHWETPLK